MGVLVRKDIASWFRALQEEICHGLEATDGKGKFHQDQWDRPGGGGGRTRTLTNGTIIEKGGVNFSEVHGPTPPKILQALGFEKANFYAAGVSIVIHPYNPLVPIIHMNVRYFEMSPASVDAETSWWFGGGIDLTPHYIDYDDAKFFHEQLKTVCDLHHPTYYQEFKKWADDYFYLKHREETRGVGGIFFDRLSDQPPFSKEDRWQFVQDVGKAFLPIYRHLMLKNHDRPYGEQEKSWQQVRRGRYVEFNLVWDKGTKFGLDTGGRTESILMSLPPQANWHYNFLPTEGSPEYQTQLMLRKNMDWIDGADS
jgi:coproporphyrinogen III oxidase